MAATSTDSEVERKTAARPHTDNPRWLLIPGALALLFLAVPLVALLLKAPWSSMLSRLASPLVRDALVLSLVSAALATMVCLVLGVPLAVLLARARGRTAAIARALVVVPLVLPPVVGGVALLLTFGRSGLLGGPAYSATGLALPFSTAGVVVAEAFVALPFMVLAVEGALRAMDAGVPQTAAALGASPSRVLFKVTLPMVAPAIAAGAVLSFARAIGEFGATVTFAGSLPGTTQTTPLAVYAALQSDQADAIAMSVILVLLSIVALVLGRSYWFGRRA